MAVVKLDKSKLHPDGVVEEHVRKLNEDLRFYWSEDGGLDSEKVVSVDCSLCGAACPEEYIFERQRFLFRRCPNCGLVYPSPRPKSSLIKEVYETGRFTNLFKNLYLPSASYRMDTIFKERVVDIIKPRVSSGRILDVGCSSGHFLKVAHNHGFDVYGIEPNKEMVEFATDELCLPNIQTGTLDEDTYQAGFFDVITLWDVLEHVERPADLLKKVRLFLKNGGWVFAYTENIESFNFFMTGNYSEIIDPLEHIRHYSPSTFRLEFEKAGFSIEKVYTCGLDIDHIKSTFATFPDIFSEHEWPVSLEESDAFQELINTLGKGDNLRLFAKKPV